MAFTIITTSLPQGITGVAYSQTIQTADGVAPIAFAVDSGSLPTGLSLNAGTGVISGTPTTPGTYNFVIEATDDDSFTDTQSYTVKVYDPLNTSPDPLVGEDAVVVAAGSQIDFSVAGGSGSYVWSVDGGNLINPLSGLLTAINGGNYTVTVTDTISGQTATVSILVTSQSQFCVAAEQTGVEASGNDVCCEYNVECGDRIQLRVPSFHIVENGFKKAIVYGNLVQMVTGEAAALTSKANPSGATGNEVSFGNNVYYEIVTSFDMAATANGEFGIGWSAQDVDANVASIHYAAVWFTDAGDRYVEVRVESDPQVDSKFAIAQGDAVSFGMFDGALALYINQVPMWTYEEDVLVCGDMLLDIAVEEANKSLGGYVTNLTWDIETAGTAAEVGSIDANGIYSAPTEPIAGVVTVVGEVNTANFYVNIRNIKPTPKTLHPQALLQGKRAHVWVSNRKATDNDVIRLASDGSPDALQNPGMIYLGVLESSAKFSEDNTYQDFTNDEGIYDTVLTEEKAMLEGTYLEVRDLDKLSLLMQQSTLYPKVKGTRELGVGGKTCGGCDLRALLIVDSGSCGSGWDVIYMPKVQNNSNLNMEIGKKVASKYELRFRVLPDTTRPAGKQLYSIYQIDGCSTDPEQDRCE